VVFQEMYSGALELSCKGVSGYIYRCVGEYEMREDHGVKFCAVSYKPVPVADVEHIEDLYEKIMDYQQQGKFIYEKYEELPQWRHSIIRGHVMGHIKNLGLLENPQHEQHEFFRQKFPKYWAEAEVLNKHGLL